MHNLAICTAVFLVAVLYSAVGHGGASGYLAIMSLAGIAPGQMASTALLLNIFVATLSVAAYARAGHFRIKQALPYVALSIPAAFLGGITPISSKVYYGLLGVALSFSAYRLAFGTGHILGPGEIKPAAGKIAVLIGAGLGWVSGMIGVGGGIFLSPIVLLKRWATPQQTSAIAAFFIVVNSIAGMLGRLSNGTFHTIGNCVPFACVAIAGGAIGSYLGANTLSRKAICKTLATVLSIAVAKLALAIVH